MGEGLVDRTDCTASGLVANGRGPRQPRGGDHEDTYTAEPQKLRDVRPPPSRGQSSPCLSSIRRLCSDAGQATGPEAVDHTLDIGVQLCDAVDGHALPTLLNLDLSTSLGIPPGPRHLGRAQLGPSLPDVCLAAPRKLRGLGGRPELEDDIVDVLPLVCLKLGIVAIICGNGATQVTATSEDGSHDETEGIEQRTHDASFWHRRVTAPVAVGDIRSPELAGAAPPPRGDMASTHQAHPAIPVLLTARLPVGSSSAVKHPRTSEPT